MSQVYVNEPPTLGKVCLETSVGEIEIELFSRECPKTVRNFVQLCMEGYYDRTKFHRVVKDFIVQGGDPTGTGQGGESIYGHAFKDEFHSRLRFNCRGRVGMANSGKDDNGSQFFFTMGETSELNNKHTLFGKVVGPTLYNMIKLQDGILEDDRPVHPHKILRTKILINPFPDIEPRKLIKMDLEDEDRKKKSKSKMKATKDFKLLSFGAEAEEEDDLKDIQSKFKTTSKSSHDLLNDPKLSKVVGLEVEKDDYIEEMDESAASSSKPVADEIESIRSKLSAKKSAKSSSKSKPIETADLDEDDESLTESERKRAEIKREIKALTKDLKSDKSSTNEKSEKDKSAAEGKGKKRALTEEEESNDLLISLREEKMKYASKGKIPKKGSAREEMTLALLNKFTSKLRSVPEEEIDETATTSTDNAEKKADDDDEEIAGDSWLGHKLTFAAENAILAKDANTKGDEWFDIFDPRNPLNKRRREQSKKK